MSDLKTQRELKELRTAVMGLYSLLQNAGITDSQWISKKLFMQRTGLDNAQVRTLRETHKEDKIFRKRGARTIEYNIQAYNNLSNS